MYELGSFKISNQSLIAPNYSWISLAEVLVCPSVLCWPVCHVYFVIDTVAGSSYNNLILNKPLLFAMDESQVKELLGLFLLFSYKPDLLDKINDQRRANHVCCIFYFRKPLQELS